jgi:hypothetical protein
VDLFIELLRPTSIVLALVRIVYIVSTFWDRIAILRDGEYTICVGIEKCGVGNWKTIADYIGTKATKQVEEHYWEHYMGVHGYCLPAKTIINDELVPTETLVAPNSIPEGSKDYPADASDNYRIRVIEGGYARGEAVVRDKGKDATRGKDNKIVSVPGR